MKSDLEKSIFKTIEELLYEIHKVDISGRLWYVIAQINYKFPQVKQSIEKIHNYCLDYMMAIRNDDQHKQDEIKQELASFVFNSCRSIPNQEVTYTLTEKDLEDLVSSIAPTIAHYTLSPEVKKKIKDAILDFLKRKDKDDGDNKIYVGVINSLPFPEEIVVIAIGDENCSWVTKMGEAENCKINWYVADDRLKLEPGVVVCTCDTTQNYLVVSKSKCLPEKANVAGRVTSVVEDYTKKFAAIPRCTMKEADILQKLHDLGYDFYRVKKALSLIP